ncbi:MAG: prolipoprotein diacylglyceryl transferase [Clostridia bacterium]|nr:prolipoprotein diacylglyceryl transferase [Clostridia bacterium]
MHPYLFGIEALPSYIVFIFIGIVAAFICYRFLADKVTLDQKSFVFFGVAAIVATAIGFVFAWLFQMLYNFIESGEIGSGITFMGGLLGGIAIFFTTYFLFGKKHKEQLPKFVSVATPCIVLAHGIGRVGCFLAGCCYGKTTSSFIGVRFVESIKSSGEYIMGDPRIPTQLIEAIFLFALFAALLLIIFKLKKPQLSILIYLYSYSIFRFVLEFLRDDPRGALVLGLSPSQALCILMLIAAVLTHVISVRKKQG